MFAINPPNTPIIGPGGRMDPAWYRFFAQLQRAVGGDLLDRIQSAPYITTALSDTLNSESVLGADPPIEVVFTEASATIYLMPSGVEAGAYGDASTLIRVNVDQYGRVTDIEEFLLDSDNVTEGSMNLFFTQARARGSISVASPLLYDVASGAISLGTVTEANGGTGLTSYLAGDMIYAVNTSTLARLGIGGSGSVLTSNGTFPSWTGSTGAGAVVRASAPTFTAPPTLPSYTVATLPSASPAFQTIGVSDESGGAVLAFSDGTNWRRVTDRAIVS